MMWSRLWLLISLFALPVCAMDLQVKMLAKDSALIVIDGKQRMLRAGAVSPEGVKLISANGQQAVVEVAGKRATLMLNRQIQTQFKQAEKSEVRIASARGGHHITPGRINGMPVEFMVDTGATFVSMNYREAEKLGLDYRAGKPVSMNTANGNTLAYQIVLNSVSVGDIELSQVLGVVHTSASPKIILLGNSYLGKLNLSLESGVLVLKEK